MCFNYNIKMDYRELIKNFEKKDYESDINLHVHSNFSDGEFSPEQILEQARRRGLRYIAITDHNTVGAHVGLRDGMLIPAIEFDSWCGTVFLHILGYGVDVSCPELLELCAKTKRETEADWIRIFSPRRPKKIIDAIHKAGGIAVLAHPACCWAISLEATVKKLMKMGLDGLEVYYPYSRHRGIIKFHLAKNVEKIADKFKLIKTGGTDEHGGL